mmetsp:Transcript_5741/g.18125  ORF Transcript_5741/g.18125 Transcript_5741/m.18125 type:complete len:246 (+) Transcript_5741:306-1043(+)
MARRVRSRSGSDWVVAATKPAARVALGPAASRALATVLMASAEASAWILTASAAVFARLSAVSASICADDAEASDAPLTASMTPSSSMTSNSVSEKPWTLTPSWLAWVLSSVSTSSLSFCRPLRAATAVVLPTAFRSATCAASRIARYGFTAAYAAFSGSTNRIDADPLATTFALSLETSDGGDASTCRSRVSTTYARRSTSGTAKKNPGVSTTLWNLPSRSTTICSPWRQRFTNIFTRVTGHRV